MTLVRRTWLAHALGVASSVAIISAFADAAMHRALAKAYLPPLTAAVVVSAVLTFPSFRRLLLGTASTAAVVGLAASGWGYSLDARATEVVFSSRHPNLGRPVHCRRDHDDQSLFGTRYVCGWPGAPDGMLVRVDDATIVQEYP